MRPQQIIEEIEALSGHYMRPIRSTEEHSRWLQDYVEDMKDLPDHTVRLACKSWRANAANQKMATPGQIVSLAKQYQIERKGEDEAFKPWRPLEPDEFERLSLREKIRYHGIAASVAQRRAGPMWDAGRPVTIAEMSPDRQERWRTWSAQAGRHAAEAERLRKFLKREDATA